MTSLNNLSKLYSKNEKREKRDITGNSVSVQVFQLGDICYPIDWTRNGFSQSFAHLKSGYANDTMASLNHILPTDDDRNEIALGHFMSNQSLLKRLICLLLILLSAFTFGVDAARLCLMDSECTHTAH